MSIVLENSAAFSLFKILLKRSTVTLGIMSVNIRGLSGPLDQNALTSYPHVILTALFVLFSIIFSLKSIVLSRADKNGFGSI